MATPPPSDPLSPIGIRTTSGRWRSELPEGDARVLWEAVGPELQRLGYD